MPKPRSESRDKAQALWLESAGKTPMIEIANQLGLSEGTVRGWKAKDRWDDILNGTLQSNGTERSEKNTERSKRGTTENPAVEGNGAKATPLRKAESGNKTQSPKARYGNRNAVGNSGGAPIGNKRALTTGEYETIEYAGLTDEEKALYSKSLDKYEEQYDLLGVQRVIRHRMMRRLDETANAPGGMVIDSVVKTKGTTATKRKPSNTTADETIDNTQTIADSAAKRVMQLEDALNRNMAGTQRGIAQLHKMEVDDAKKDVDPANVAASAETNVVFVLPDDGRKKAR